MLLSIKHTTDLFYNDYINESVMELRMAPRQEQNQRRLSFSIDIGPATSVKSYFDWLGNTIHAFSINALHDRIQIIATSIVETEPRQHKLQLFPDVWLPDANFDYTLCDFLLFDGAIVDSPMLRDLAAGVLAQVTPASNTTVKYASLDNDTNNAVDLCVERGGLLPAEALERSLRLTIDRGDSVRAPVKSSSASNAAADLYGVYKLAAVTAILDDQPDLSEEQFLARACVQNVS